MSLSNSRLSYQDCYDLLDRALDADRGICVTVPDKSAANYLRMRIHHARTIDREENRKTYPDPDQPLHGRSPYDILVLRIDGDDDEGKLYLDKQKVEILGIEDIPVDAQIEYTPQLRLEGPKSEALPEVEIINPTPPVPTIRRR